MRCASLPRAFVGILGLTFASSLLATPALFAAPQNRIRANITNGARAEIAGTVHPRAHMASDLGPTAGDTKLSMSLRFSMTAAQSAALDQLLADQQNPVSPRYHQWLTAAEFGAQFGLSPTDIAKVTAWLTAQGFSVTGVANSATFVSFDGTVAQADAAFGTSIHNLTSQGEQHYGNVADVSVPAVLSNVVGSITGLHNFHPHAHASVATHPQFTSSVSGTHYLAPGDFYVIYDMEPLLSGGYTGAGIGTGANCHSTGATCGDIVVVGQVDLYNNSTQDVSAFRTAAGLNAANLPATVHEGGDPGQASLTCSSCFPNAGDLEESSLDVEWSGAMAPGASILFVNGPDVIANAMTQAIDQNLAPIITNSYGNCETSWGSSELNSFNQLFKLAAAQGQTILTASADAGATDCDAGTVAQQGLTVDFPASSPYVTGLGGSMLNEGTATGATTYWLGTDTTFTAGSAVPNADVSAKSYIPEAVWNEDSAGSTFAAGGGGVSAFFSKPSWQVETGAAGMTTSVPADASRDVPDIALDAASAHDGMLFCYAGSCVSGFRQSAGGNLTVAGGTSFDSQAFGGMLALIEQKVGPSLTNGPRLGTVNSTLYALGNNTAYYNSGGTSVFHDITTGNNSNPCSAGTPDCPNGGSIGYSASTGYDLSTGWGSVDLNNLALAWSWGATHPIGSGPAGTTVSSTALTTTPTCTGGTTGPCTLSVATSNSITLTATVTGSSGAPTGTIQFLDNNAALGSPVSLSSGVATYTYNATCSALGQQDMSAVYSGDGTYAGSKGPALPAVQANGTTDTTPLLVTVTSGTCPDFSLTPSGTNTSSATIVASGSNASITVSAGGTIPPVTITVGPLNGFAGTVSFTASAVSNTGYTPAVTFNPASLTFTGSSSASQTTTVSFSGITADLLLPGAPGNSRHGFHPWYAAGSGVAVASLFLIVLPRRRRLGGLLALALAAAVSFSASGCSSSSSTTASGGNNTSTNPYAGTYVVNVIATYSSGGQNTVHSSTLTYTIN